MKTIDVKFQGKDYKVRRNMYTLHLFEQELKASKIKNDFLATVIFAWCALRGFNEFNESLEFVLKHIDEPENESLLLAIPELFKSEIKEDNVPKNADTEKK